MRRFASSTPPICKRCRQLGARVVFFSPLADAALAPCDAVWLPGGYPELHTARIAANTGMQASLMRPWTRRQAPVGRVRRHDGAVRIHALPTAPSTPLWGLLPGQVTMHKRLAALGPQQLAVAGHTLRGHTFHYSTATAAPRGGAHSAAR
jgi:cobyrinic acid a,c-diamide synthase